MYNLSDKFQALQRNFVTAGFFVIFADCTQKVDTLSQAEFSIFSIFKPEKQNMLTVLCGPWTDRNTSQTTEEEECVSDSSNSFSASRVG